MDRAAVAAARRRPTAVNDVAFRATVLTLYPEMFPGLLGQSLSGKALARGDWALDCVQIRDFATDRHRSVDDTPAGGGAGMVLKPDVLARAIDHASEGDDRPRLLMSPRGRPLTQTRVRELAAGEGAIIVCGRFEGVDQRVIEGRGLEEVSIGDYILSGGEPAAMILLDAVVRILPGVMGNALSGEHESFEGGLLEHPHYTRPQVWEDREIPAVLTSGNHAAIEKWRSEEALKLTRERRPDLLAAQPITK
jgi:tRNA (guanine37-N1)-methyltransferase